MGDTEQDEAGRAAPVWVGVRVQPELLEAARARSGIASNSALIRYSLAVVAELDNPEQYAQHVKPGPRGPRRRETDPPDGGQKT